jgi:tetratricopeptide (TPR) repeat protein
MFTNRKKRLWLLGVALVLVGGMVFVLTSNNALAQGPDLKDVDTRLTALEKTVDDLFNFIIVIPALAAIMVVVLELRTWLTERSEVQLAREREQREAKSAVTVDAVMSSVNQILTFQAKQAGIGTRLLETFNPSKGIEAVLGDAKELRRQVKRHNLYQHHVAITRLAEKMQNLEDLYVDLPDFRESIDCNYIRGLAGHLNSQIEATDKYFRAVGELIARKGPLDNLEAMSLYFLGVHRKNLNLLGESLECLERALEIWSRGEREILTRIEIAEVVALDTRYTDDKKRVRAAHHAIDEVLDADRTRSQPLTPEQKANLDALKERLYLIEGNYAFRHGDWDGAIENYEKGRLLELQGVFTTLSIGLAHWKQGLIDEAKQELDQAYHLIVDSHRHLTHFERRGRILRGGSAAIAAKLCGLGDPVGLLGLVLKEIEDLRWRNPETGHTFHIFSPLTKEMHTLTDFENHISRPLDFFQ